MDIILELIKIISDEKIKNLMRFENLIKQSDKIFEDEYKKNLESTFGTWDKKILNLIYKNKPNPIYNLGNTCYIASVTQLFRRIYPLNKYGTVLENVVYFDNNGEIKNRRLGGPENSEQQDASEYMATVLQNINDVIGDSCDNIYAQSMMVNDVVAPWKIGIIPLNICVAPDYFESLNLNSPYENIKIPKGKYGIYPTNSIVRSADRFVIKNTKYNVLVDNDVEMVSFNSYDFGDFGESILKSCFTFYKKFLEFPSTMKWCDEFYGSERIIELNIPVFGNYIILTADSIIYDNGIKRNITNIGFSEEGINLIVNVPKIDLNFTNSGELNFKIEYIKYNLVACVFHIGSNINQGHYTVIVKKENAWYYCSDETITVMSVNDIHEFFKVPKDNTHPTIYLLEKADISYNEIKMYAGDKTKRQDLESIEITNTIRGNSEKDSLIKYYTQNIIKTKNTTIKKNYNIFQNFIQPSEINDIFEYFDMFKNKYQLPNNKTNTIDGHLNYYFDSVCDFKEKIDNEYYKSKDQIKSNIGLMKHFFSAHSTKYLIGNYFLINVFKHYFPQTKETEIELYDVNYTKLYVKNRCELKFICLFDKYISKKYYYDIRPTLIKNDTFDDSVFKAIFYNPKFLEHSYSPPDKKIRCKIGDYDPIFSIEKIKTKTYITTEYFYFEKMIIFKISDIRLKKVKKNIRINYSCPKNGHIFKKIHRDDKIYQYPGENTLSEKEIINAAEKHFSQNYGNILFKKSSEEKERNIVLDGILISGSGDNALIKKNGDSYYKNNTKIDNDPNYVELNYTELSDIYLMYSDPAVTNIQVFDIDKLPQDPIVFIMNMMSTNTVFYSN